MYFVTGFSWFSIEQYKQIIADDYLARSFNVELPTARIMYFPDIRINNGLSSEHLSYLITDNENQIIFGKKPKKKPSKKYLIRFMGDKKTCELTSKFQYYQKIFNKSPERQFNIKNLMNYYTNNNSEKLVKLLSNWQELIALSESKEKLKFDKLRLEVFDGMREYGRHKGMYLDYQEIKELIRFPPPSLYGWLAKKVGKYKRLSPQFENIKLRKRESLSSITALLNKEPFIDHSTRQLEQKGHFDKCILAERQKSIDYDVKIRTDQSLRRFLGPVAKIAEVYYKKNGSEYYAGRWEQTNQSNRWDYADIFSKLTGYNYSNRVEQYSTQN